MVKFIRPTEEAIVAVAQGMRAADTVEVWLSSHHSPETALRRSVDESPVMCLAAVAPEGPLCIFGVGSSLLSDTGSPWMLGTDLLDHGYRRFLAAHSRRFVAAMRHRWSRLENWVHADNLRSVRWLEACGFTLGPPESFGAESALFRHFWMNREA